ncbi:hypothetical protein [Comamonas testosteroni]|uniref:hypothetical protein n=1 Tax=Comamonas testosteroni TaxID=285 RepID=UPI000AAFB063|nr:hypothetical protein [Comamonas testosteroni]
MRSQQLPVHLHLTHQGVDLGVSAFDQSDKLANHARAFASKGCESLVLICEISAGSGVTGKLGVTGGGGSDVVLQACNAGSISSAASLQGCELLRVVMGVFLLSCGVLQSPCGFDFHSSLRLLCLG